MLRPQHAERGQTLVFWAFSLAAALGLTFFVVNYSGTVRWHIRGQNAADAAALTTIAADASMRNQVTTTEYTLAVEEYRIRSIMYSMINGANSVGGCVSSGDDTGTDCDNAYDQEPEYFDQAVGQYATTLAQLKALKTASAPQPMSLPSVNGQPQTLPNAPSGSAAPAAFSLVASAANCWDSGSGQPVFDCSFGYAANPDLSQTGLGTTNEYVDILACRKVTNTVPGIFAGPKTFAAMGRAAATLRPVVESNFSPGVGTDPNATPNPNTGIVPPYQPKEDCPPIQIPGPGQCTLTQGWLTLPPYVVDYSGLSITATFYVPELTAPVGGITGTPVCKAG